MPDSTRDFDFQRILVFLDVTSDHAAVLASAATLARRFDAELTAHFVEDRRLCKLEEHPCARAIDLPTGTVRSIEGGSMRRDGRALARRMRRTLDELAHSYQVDAEFEYIYDEALSQLGQRVCSSDLLVVEKACRAVMPHQPVRSCGLSVARETDGAVFFAGRNTMLRDLVVLYDGSQMSQRGLDAAIGFLTDRLDCPVLLVRGEGASQSRENSKQEAMSKVSAN